MQGARPAGPGGLRRVCGREPRGSAAPRPEPQRRGLRVLPRPGGLRGPGPAPAGARRPQAPRGATAALEPRVLPGPGGLLPGGHGPR
ncbi:MAG: hypothetical protein D6708_09150, partial [Candidatus Dadabacteria bacterium]